MKITMSAAGAEVPAKKPGLKVYGVEVTRITVAGMTIQNTQLILPVVFSSPPAAMKYVRDQTRKYKGARRFKVVTLTLNDIPAESESE